MRSTTRRSSTASACARPRRLRYDNNDMAQLEQRLQEAADARYRLIATDGVFSMDGVLADLAGDLRSRRAVRRDGDGRRLACGRASSAPTAAARPSSLRRDGSRRHHHRHARARRSAARRAATPAAVARSSTGCVNARGRTCSPTRLAPVIAAATMRVLDLLRVGRRAPTPARAQRGSGSAPGWQRPASRSPVPAIRSSR